MDLKNLKIIVDFEPISRRVILSSDEPIYNLLSELNIPIRSICGGSGTCGKCKLLIQKGKEFFISPTTIEKKFIDQKELEYGWHLACQARIDINKLQFLEKSESPQIRVFLPNELLLEDFNILTSGINKGVEFNPAIKKLYVEVEKPSLKKPIPDLERIESSILNVNKDLNRIDTQLYFNFDLLNLIPNILRESDHKITLTLWNNNEIIACESGNTIKENFGIAFDIGTTTIVGYLINLNNGMIYRSLYVTHCTRFTDNARYHPMIMRL